MNLHHPWSILSYLKWRNMAFFFSSPNRHYNSALKHSTIFSSWHTLSKTNLLRQLESYSYLTFYLPINQIKKHDNSFFRNIPIPRHTITVFTVLGEIELMLKLYLVIYISTYSHAITNQSKASFPKALLEQYKQLN